MAFLRRRSIGQGNDDNFRITVLGAKGVGKSSIVSRFLYNKYNPKKKPTVQELHHGSYGTKNRISLDIVDTSGSEKFLSLRKMAISNSDAFILVFAVNDEHSMRYLEKIREQIIQIKGHVNCPLVVVGNKSDTDEGHSLLEKTTRECIVCLDWEHEYTEVSAKDNINIFNVFKEIVFQINNQYPLRTNLRYPHKSVSF